MGSAGYSVAAGRQWADPQIIKEEPLNTSLLSKVEYWESSDRNLLSEVESTGIMPRNFWTPPTLPVHSPAFFPKLHPIFHVLAVANTCSCVDSQNQKVTLPEAGSCVECPRNINRLKTKQNITSGMMTCEVNNLEIAWSLCSALMWSFVDDWAQSTYQLTN